ncbi:TPA: methylglyoxal synthase, partial [Enterococcus faecium]|nr:methylglyoxal synthase [Enterococcus faecium]
IGAMISEDQLDLVIFLRDPLAAQPHEPDVTALIRLSDVYEIPLATNIGTAEVLLRGLEAGFLDFRRIVHEIDKHPLSF